MDLNKLLQKMFNEQQWRENKVQQMFPKPGISDGRSLTLAELMNMDPRYKMMMNYYDRENQTQLKEDSILRNLTQQNQGKPPPDYFLERLFMNQMMDSRRQQNQLKQQELL